MDRSSKPGDVALIAPTDQDIVLNTLQYPTIQQILLSQASAVLCRIVQHGARYSGFQSPPRLSNQRFLTTFIFIAHNMGRPLDLLTLDDIDPRGDLLLLLYKSQDGRQR